MLRRVFSRALIGSGMQPILFTDQLEENKNILVTSGKAWDASLLRRKSYEDLHTLWYVLLREKNLLISDNQLRRQQKVHEVPKHRIVKVKKSMARILTVLSEREKEKKAYWKELEDEYMNIALPPPPPPPPKVERELTEEQIHQREKRKLAISRIKKWRWLTKKQKRQTIKAEYGKMAHESKLLFIKELKYLGQLYKEQVLSKQVDSNPEQDINQEQTSN